MAFSGLLHFPKSRLLAYDTINTPGDIGGNGVGGTANLKPYKSVNFDLDYEYYFAKNSYFSVDLFYKDIENYIVNTTSPA